ncbi:MAG: exodeoxyribonuclease VII small subunit [Holosporales bacterium]|jgi:exodeoxyribonuclease VII small subunit|nr:exodeoxyribonuclease VII small subunit [Holosporales bacterium]
MEETTNLKFEEALKELEVIVEKLGEGNTPLEQAIELYEKGAILRKHCQQMLDNAKLRIDKVVQDGDKINLIPVKLEE